MLAAAAAALMAAMALMLIRALLGPSPYDRMLAANSFGTKTVLFIGLAGFLFGRPDFLDLAIAYALINFVATIALMKVVRYRSLQASLSVHRGPGEAGGG
ncbi:MAG: monovalent cation/H+ antiporter complex subunit F [Alphaproteobacteria bacterium]|nr:monovalent cation/H+ antiporter complex subunit F [Alphaproteobacteria bacterium]